MNIRTLLRLGRERLQERGVRLPAADSELLLSTLLNCDRSFLIVHDDHVLNEDQEKAYLAALEKRCSGMPMQYIRGKQEFWGRDFLVTSEVLIPRPETELLVEHALRIARSAWSLNTDATPVIADVATGSGCLAVCLALELAHAKVVATDISPQAIAVARRNAQSHGILEKVEFLVGDLGTPLVAKFGPGAFDMIVCNPPYGAWGDTSLFEKEVIEFEPHQALFGGQIGTETIERLIPQVWDLLKPQGYFLIEIGIGQSERVSVFLCEGWGKAEVYSDLQGIPRCVVVQKVADKR